MQQPLAVFLPRQQLGVEIADLLLQLSQLLVFDSQLLACCFMSGRQLLVLFSQAGDECTAFRLQRGDIFFVLLDVGSFGRQKNVRTLLAGFDYFILFVPR